MGRSDLLRMRSNRTEYHSVGTLNVLYIPITNGFLKVNRAGISNVWFVFAGTKEWRTSTLFRFSFLVYRGSHRGMKGIRAALSLDLKM